MIQKRNIARVFAPLLEPARYKGAFGGRGSGKSHFFGEQLVEDALYYRGLLAVCIREVQRTLAQSSKRLIEHKIRALGVGSEFRIYKDNIVPGLLAIILTMTMVLMTCLALTRERERGTYENLLAMPVTPLEIMIGKITPNILVGAIQSAIILAMAKFVFGVPMVGSFALLGLGLSVYIVANLAVGYTFSTIAQNQLQAMQMTMFFLMPAILLSGFAFPFQGMPVWAQWIGETLPATHFLRIVRGILLKDNGLTEIWPDLWPLFAFAGAAGTVALARFRRTLD